MSRPTKPYDVVIELTVRVDYRYHGTSVADAERDGNTTTLREALGLMVQDEPSKYSIRTVSVKETK
jgi:hypothetical protein